MLKMSDHRAKVAHRPHAGLEVEIRLRQFVLGNDPLHRQYGHVSLPLNIMDGFMGHLFRKNVSQGGYGPFGDIDIGHIGRLMKLSVLSPDKFVYVQPDCSSLALYPQVYASNFHFHILCFL